MRLQAWLKWTAGRQVGSQGGGPVAKVNGDATKIQDGSFNPVRSTSDELETPTEQEVGKSCSSNAAALCARKEA